MEIIISRDFSETPNARHKSDGPNSGEEFRDLILIPKYLEAKSNNKILIVNLDGCYGYPTSFLEEAFGGLARQYEIEEVLNTLSFISEDEPSLIDEIRNYILNARKGGATV